MTPTEALAQALHESREDIPFRDYTYKRDVLDEAAPILAALPEGSALVTTETLATALRSPRVLQQWETDDRDDLVAAAIIEAVRRG